MHCMQAAARRGVEQLSVLRQPEGSRRLHSAELVNKQVAVVGRGPGRRSMKNSILLVDDEEYVIAALKRALMDDPYEISSATSGEEGLGVMEEKRFKLVISDERMPGMGGAELLSAVREKYPDTVRILLTGHASIESTIKAVNNGEVYRFFTKPWQDLELRMAIRSAIEKYDLEAERRRLLATVKSQATELRALEQRYPGISHIDRNDRGAFLLPEI